MLALLKWTKMTNSSKIDKVIIPKEAQVKQKVPGKAHIEQESPENIWIEWVALEKVHVLEYYKNSIILYIWEKNEIEIILLLIIFLLSKWHLIL